MLCDRAHPGLFLPFHHSKGPSCTCLSVPHASDDVCAMLQGKCDDDGLASTTGPLLRTAVDLGMHGVVHQATGCVVKVEMEALVADMDALMRLVGKVVCSCIVGMVALILVAVAEVTRGARKLTGVTRL